MILSLVLTTTVIKLLVVFTSYILFSMMFAVRVQLYAFSLKFLTPLGSGAHFTRIPTKLKEHVTEIDHYENLPMQYTEICLAV